MQPGDTLAHYKLGAPLGKGGMGDVYLATDTKLGREVALKILPEDFAKDQERVARFRREAQVLAALNHPNISAIYGIEEDNGLMFLAMELAPGRDLSRHLNDGIFPMAETLRIAAAITEGLAEAHEKGIIHRDLKPANITVVPESTVKILDFGLARALAADEEMPGDPDSISHSPTITAAMTQQGVIMGTAAYMSPEQARGKIAGKQADIWAFGCLLFELLTGRKIFNGETVSDAVAAILKNEPPWAELPAETPPSIHRLLRRCLEKDNRRRLHDISDARLEIDEALEHLNNPKPEVVATESATMPSRVWPAATALIALAFIAYVFLGRPAPDTTSSGPKITGLTALTDSQHSKFQPALSPDGKTLAYSARTSAYMDIFVQRVGGENAINLTADHQGNDWAPAFSPDGERIAFNSTREGGGIFVMGASGESPQRIVDRGFDPSWSHDGQRIVYSSEGIRDPYSRAGTSTIFAVNVQTKEITTISEFDGVDAAWSPSDQRIVFWTAMGPASGQRDIYTMAADGSELIPVTLDKHTDWNPYWSPDGRWIYFISDRGGSPDLWRIAIVESTGEVLGVPERVTIGTSTVGNISLSNVGTIAFSSSSVRSKIFTQTFDLNTESLGPQTEIISSQNFLTQFSLSPDGNLIAYRTATPSEHIMLISSDGQESKSLVVDTYRNRGPAFSPDGKWIAFYSNRTGSYLIWAIGTDGTGMRQVTHPPREFVEPSWLPDGRLVARSRKKSEDTYVEYVEILLPAGGLAELESPVDVTPLDITDNISRYSSSPDGRYSAYVMLDNSRACLILDNNSGTETEIVVDGLAAGIARTPNWIDNEHVFIVDVRHNRQILWQAHQRTGKVVTYSEDNSGLIFSPDHDRVFGLSTTIHAEIWQLTLEQLSD